MKSHSLLVGLNFGLTSGIITTLGLIVGINAGTHSKVAVIGSIITIAIADALSDALGIHISEEAENVHSTTEVWVSTLATFISKFVFAILFIIPVLFFSLNTAVLVSIIWGGIVLTTVSYFLAKEQKGSPWSVIGEHLLIAGIVIALTHFVGVWINATFHC